MASMQPNIPNAAMPAISIPSLAACPDAGDPLEEDDGLLDETVAAFASPVPLEEADAPEAAVGVTTTVPFVVYGTALVPAVPPIV